MPSIDRQVGVSADDIRVHWTGSAWSAVLGAAQVYVGYYNDNYYKWGSGMRFTNITIPKGSNITAAYLTIRADASRSGTTVYSKVRGEDADNPAQFSDITDYWDRPRSSAEVNWDGIPEWTLDSEYNSPDIKTVIQEIIDRAGWVSGNDLVIFWDDHDDRSDHASGCSRRGYSYDGSSAKAPKLHIEYIPPAAGAACSRGYIMG
jgi:type IV pilus assembly protein PilY1